MSDAGQVFLRMPRINANEDAAKVVKIYFTAGQTFKAGQPLFDIETTKAAAEVLAPADGRIVEILAVEDESADVGQRLCALEFTGPIVDNDADIEYEGQAGAGGEEGGVQISRRAELRAKELGVDIAKVPARAGKVRVEDVERFAGANPGQTFTPAKPIILPERYHGGCAVMIGGGGHARIILDALHGNGWTVVGCLDKNLAPGTSVLSGIEVLGPDALLDDLWERGVRAAFVGAAGSAIDSKLRRRIYDTLKSKGFIMPPVVHRTAHLGLNSELGDATYLCAGAQVGSRVLIGSGTIINTHASVAHDSIIGDHCHLTPNAVIAGTCRIGSGTTVGMCATVMNNVEIGENCIIHNNAAVAQNVPNGTIIKR